MFDCESQNNCLNKGKKCINCRRMIILNGLSAGNQDFFKPKTNGITILGVESDRKPYFKVGDFVSFVHFKTKENIKGKILKANRKYALLDCGKAKLYRVPYEVLKIETKPINYQIQTPKVVIQKVETKHNLIQLMNEVTTEYKPIFDKLFNFEEKQKLRDVTIAWNRRKTIRQAGVYNNKRNEIHISITLEKALKEPVKKVIYHELLHIKFHNHKREFRYWESQFKNYEENQKYLDSIFKDFILKELI